MSNSKDFSVRLPFPPSVNRIWRHARGRNYLSKQGTEFYAYCVPLLQAMRRGAESFHGRVKVTLNLYPPTRAKRDIDNSIKAILDAMTRAHVWDDDSQVDVLVVVRGSVMKGGGVDVCISEILE